MPRRRYPVLARLQADLLGTLRRRRLTKDEAIVAALAELGEDPPDRSTVSRWRDGTDQAPLGLFVALVDAADDPAAVLEVLAEPHGLHVSCEHAEPDTDERGLIDRALEIAERCGNVVGVVRAAVDDHHVTDEERDGIRDAAKALRKAATDLERLTRRSP